MIQITTINPLINGANSLIVGYLSPWANNIYKSLVSGVVSITSMISFDGGLNYNTSISCTINSTISKIICTYTVNYQITTGTVVVVKIIGVVSPPTVQTVASSNFQVKTADASSNIIDSYISCSINPVCVTNLTNGVINSSSSLNINSQYNTPQIYFNSNPVITVLPSDTIQVYYSPLSDLSGCNVFKFWRSGPDISTMTSPTLTSFYTFAVSSSAPAN